ncbi:putative DNA-binding protein escarola [Phtheirospermum japonicum]|uniref:Putative DNA-binding protein escarola n=1 Tax=Phtheirospermum japonicum TaxID=374723 RepID=A0A830C4V0_9LAMI|nr:putative DNA-binding protein escarola [Phtheirospermum japonicum]
MGSDGATIEVVRRPGGAPRSKNRPKPPVIVTRDSPSEPSMSPYVLELPPGVDVIESTARFCRKRGTGPLRAQRERRRRERNPQAAVHHPRRHHNFPRPVRHPFNLRHRLAALQRRRLPSVSGRTPPSLYPWRGRRGRWWGPSGGAVGDCRNDLSHRRHV